MTDPTHQPAAAAPEGPALPRIENFTIVRKIDEGGMGEVYEALQERPVRRRVAVKLIKRGMDSDEVVGRFESERQALAVMNHPNIARVFDAGVTESGRPYFVMEFVEGVPLTEYCDEKRLPMEERLRLFLEVCEATQHAHQKGIIHRDLKPSNVLVECRDGRHVPKVIDFGLAKATAQPLTERLEQTAVGTPLGTPEYMSPEQFDFTCSDIDTRTDVYSLGIILYELMVGSRPFDAKTIIEEGLFEFIRQVREDDVPRPSTRTTDLVATTRHTGTAELCRTLRGDLDWIVVKALEKDRDRRYSSASELAADLERHLANEPVLAGPPGGMYRARKFVRRHRLAVSAGIALVLALGLGIAGTSIALVRAVRAEDLASQEAARATNEARTARRIAGFLTGLFEVSDPGRSRGDEITAREILDRGAAGIDGALEEEPEVRAALMDTMGVVYSSLGLYEPALALLRAALTEREQVLGAEHPQVAETLVHLGETLRLGADFAAAEPALRRSLEIRRAANGERDPAVAESLHVLGLVLCARGEYAAAETMLREALDMRRELLGTHPDVADSLDALAACINAQRFVEDTEPLLREALEIRRATLGDHPKLAESLSNLSTYLYERNQFDAAEPMIEEALVLKRRYYGEVHPEVAVSLNDLAFLLHDRRDLDGAEEMYRQAVAIERQLLGDAHPSLGQALNNLAFVLREKGDYDGARAAFFDSLAAYCGALGFEHPTIEGILDNAVRFHWEAIGKRKQAHGEASPEVASALADLATLYLETGRPEEAEAPASEAWEIYLDVPEGEDEVRRARVECVYGLVLSRMGEFDVAEELLSSGRERLLASPGGDPAQARAATEHLIELYEAWDRPSEAREFRDLLAGLAPEQ